MARRDTDVLVVGAGMVGAAAACLFARAGMRVCILEAETPVPFDPAQPVGLRVSAISPGSARVLEAAGAWERVEQARHCPYRRMRVEDREGGPALEFASGEFGLERLGTIVENDLLQWSLWQCLKETGSVEVVCPVEIASFSLRGEWPAVRLRDGREIRARMLVGADGGNSALRQALGIGQQYWAYGQKAIVAVVRTERPNLGLAWQRFLPGGPLAFLPLADGASSIVWTRPSAEAEQLLALDEAAFCRELQAAAGSGDAAVEPFGAVVETGPRAAFPLSLQLADRYAAGRCVLIGDAAHVVHPLAGQGVNLGFLDAAALVETAARARRESGDAGEPRRLLAFARWRRSEAEILARGIHGLHALFLPEPLGALRRLGLGIVGRSWPLREVFIRRAAGINRNAPALARGVPLHELLIP
jgi:2-octaprenyl-3-methyl-6-methoxy-1,4-benzoquinol hydroxylase/2-octaprenylphenol hydroxylase